MPNYSNKDIAVDHEYDLIIIDDENRTDIIRTNTFHDYETFSQVMMNCLKTSKGDFIYSQNFGASPFIFKGRRVTPELIRDIEEHIRMGIVTSRLFDNLRTESLVVKGVPLPPGDIVGIQIKGIFPFRVGYREVKLNLIYSITDNNINPV
jgi:hypothetical protein